MPAMRRSQAGYPRVLVSRQLRNGRFMKDPIPHYDRGRTRLDLCPDVHDEECDEDVAPEI